MDGVKIVKGEIRTIKWEEIVGCEIDSGGFKIQKERKGKVKDYHFSALAIKNIDDLLKSLNPDKVKSILDRL